MNSYSLRTHRPADTDTLNAIQTAYARACPGMTPVPAEIYCGPAFSNGDNLQIAVDGTGKIAAYAAIYPVLVEDPNQPHTCWAAVIVDPAAEKPTELFELLINWLEQKTAAVVASLKNQSIQVVFQVVPGETSLIAFLESLSYQHTENVFRMQRDLSLPIPPSPDLTGLTIRFWQMETPAEVSAYVSARNRAFPAARVTVEEIQYFQSSPNWQSGGGVVAAFAGEELASSLMTFSDDADPYLGYTEYIFTLPEWRGRGLAQSIICIALRHLTLIGKTRASLEVRAENTGALTLYTRLGYQVVHESWFLTRKMNA